MVSWSGMPGIGPLGLKPFFSSSALGMPGVFALEGGIFAFSEMPGGRVFELVIGLAESPGGILAGSSFISLTGSEFESAFALTSVFEGAFAPQPTQAKTTAKVSKKIEFLNIFVCPFDLKYLCRFECCVSKGAATAFKPARVGNKLLSC